MNTCDHRWLRLPIVDLSVIYQCRDCKKALQFSWLAAAGGALSDLDRAFEAKYGGRVTQQPDPAGEPTPHRGPDLE